VDIYDKEGRMKKSQICHSGLLIIALLTGLFLPNSSAAETCEEWVAKVVSVQGNVQAQRTAEKEWKPVKFNNTYCIGDMLRVLERSRAAILL
jgi:hypothetical protein